MITLESRMNSMATDGDAHEEISFPELRPKRDAPPWVKTIVRADSDDVWSVLRRELPHPLAGERTLPTDRSERFPGCESAVGQAEALLAGRAVFKEAISGNERQRLELLIVLLDAFGRGEHPSDDKVLGEIWSWIWREAGELASSNADHSSGDERDPAAPLRNEALLASGVYFAGLVGMRSRAKEGRKNLWRDLAERVDSDGTPAADLWDEMPVPLAALVRCGAWADAGDLRWGKQSELDLCDGLARCLAAGLGPVGSNNGQQTIWLRALGSRLGWKKSDPAMRFLGSYSGKTKAKAGASSTNGKAIKPKRTGGPAFQSEWGKVMVTRSGWDQRADHLAVRHGGEMPVIECQVGGCPLLTGHWGLEIRVDGESVELPSEWDAVSWFEDREVIYLELQVSDLEELVVCRQFLFARGDQQLWTADSVSRPKDDRSEIEIISHLPLVDRWKSQRVPPTRELLLRDADGGGPQVRCFPLAYPMDATWPSSGRIDANEEGLTVRQTGRGGVYSPLLFDWHGRRRETAVDWRPLTVTEDGRRMNSGQAVASRVRLGRRQWMIYRNLNGSAAMRAVLGYHHNQESVIGRFNRAGEIDPLVLVEANDTSDD